MLQHNFSESEERNTQLDKQVRDLTTKISNLETKNAELAKSSADLLAEKQRLTADSKKVKEVQGLKSDRLASAIGFLQQHRIAAAAGTYALFTVLASLVTCLLYRKYRAELAALSSASDRLSGELQLLQTRLTSVQATAENKTEGKALPPSSGTARRSKLETQRYFLKEQEAVSKAPTIPTRGNQSAIRAHETSVAPLQDLPTPAPASAMQASPVPEPAPAAPVFQSPPEPPQPGWRQATFDVERDYNTARAHADDGGAWFLQTYSCTGLSCQNLSDLRPNPNAEIRFEASGFGKFLGVARPDGEYLLPAFDMEFGAGRSSLEGVFVYPAAAGSYMLTKAASITRSGDGWVLRDRGVVAHG